MSTRPRWWWWSHRPLAVLAALLLPVIALPAADVAHRPPAPAQHPRSRVPLEPFLAALQHAPSFIALVSVPSCWHLDIGPMDAEGLVVVASERPLMKLEPVTYKIDVFLQVWRQSTDALGHQCWVFEYAAPMY